MGKVEKIGSLGKGEMRMQVAMVVMDVLVMVVMGVGLG